MKTAQTVLGLSQTTDKAHALVAAVHWQSLSRNEFLNRLERVTPIVHQLVGQLETAQTHAIDQGLPEADELSDAAREMSKLEAFLINNLEMEARKKNVSEAQNRFESSDAPGVYAAVEQRVLGTLLKMRFLLERMSISAKKHGLSPVEHKATAQNVLGLLREKESELQSMRFKYEDLRKRAYVGAAEDDALAGEFSALSDTEADLARQTVILDEQKKKIITHLGPLQALFSEFSHQIDRHAHLSREASVRQKNVLKKIAQERDYAQRVLLDIEHETLQLRNRYSSELLNLQENKFAAQKNAEEKFARHHQTLSRNLAKQDELLAHLKRSLDERDARIAKLESALTETRLALHTHQKHARVKKALQKKPKK